jgi:hypothetical protein
MASGSQKIEHSGPKKGQGAFWGRKARAKAISDRLRREQGKQEIRTEKREAGRDSEAS